MISTALARELREAGLLWTPASGDSFQITLTDFSVMWTPDLQCGLASGVPA